MALWDMLDIDALLNFGIHTIPRGQLACDSPHQPTDDVWPLPMVHHYNIRGYEGSGVDLLHMLSMWPMFLFALVWFGCRTIGRKFVFNRIARWAGVRGTKKQRKFGYSLWLALFYSTSTLFGWWVFGHEPYMSFPIDTGAAIHLHEGHPRPITPLEQLYYLYECGFFIAELFAIFVEDRRSDFLEYLIHHITTILLIMFSYGSYTHRFGVYILLLHDASDIFLCVAKVFHYAAHDVGVYIGFGLFTALFAFFRLYCFPFLIANIATTTHVTMPCLGFYWMMWCLLLVLQVLHVYWFALVVRMIFRLATGTKGDVRSDEDDASEGDTSSPATATRRSSAKKSKKAQ